MIWITILLIEISVRMTVVCAVTPDAKCVCEPTYVVTVKGGTTTWGGLTP